MNPKIHLFFYTLLCAGSLLYLSGCAKGNEEEKTPYISSVTSLSATVNETITITGGNFSSLADSSGCIIVYFPGATACAAVINDNTLEIQVPFNAGSGPVCINYKGNRICSSQSFTYIPGNPGPNTYMRLADCPSNQVTVMVAAGNTLLAGFTNWWKYDIASNTWASMTGPAENVIRATSFTINGKAYIFGGSLVAGPLSNRLQSYDPATGTWTFKTPMPAGARKDACAFVWNNKAYIVGGTDSDVPQNNTVGNQLWEYDPATNSWLRKADLPFGAADGAYAMRVGTKFYVPINVSLGAQEYDPAINTWRHLTVGYLPLNAAPYTDRDFALGYTIGGGSGGLATGLVRRWAINFTGNELMGEDYAQPPPGGYTNIFKPFYAVVNNELYYGLGYFNLNGGVVVQGPQLWRYRY